VNEIFGECCNYGQIGKFLRRHIQENIFLKKKERKKSGQEQFLVFLRTSISLQPKCDSWK